MASLHPYTTDAGHKRWRVKWRDDTNRQRSRSFADQTEAKAFAVDVERGTALDPRDGRRTLADFIERDYLPSRTGWADSTHKVAASQFTNHIGPALGASRIDAIRPTTVGRFVNELQSAGLSPKTVHAIYARLMAVMRAAKADRLIAEVPELTKHERPKLDRRDAPDLVLLDPSDVDRLAGAVPPFVSPLVWVVAGTGLRISEAVGLTIEAVDLTAGELVVERQLLPNPTTGATLTEKLKSRTSARTVPLGARARHELAEHLRRRPPLAVPDPIDGERRLIFTNRDGAPLRRQAAAYAWAAARDDLDLPAGARGWHTLRHFYASALIRSGLSVIEVQARLGHATADETLNTYGHLWTDSGTRTVDALDDIMPNPANLRAL